MPRVHFTPQLEKHVDCPTTDVQGRTLREALESVFEDNPRLKSYVLDDQSRLRQHVAVFINGSQIQDRNDLGEAVEEMTEIYVMQALSGG